MLSKTLCNKFDNVEEMEKLFEIPKLSELTQEETESLSNIFQPTSNRRNGLTLIQGVYRTLTQTSLSDEKFGVCHRRSRIRKGHQFLPLFSDVTADPSQCIRAEKKRKCIKIEVTGTVLVFYLQTK